MILECLRNRKEAHVAGAERIMGRRSKGKEEARSCRGLSTGRSWDFILISGSHCKDFSGGVTASVLFFKIILLLYG